MLQDLKSGITVKPSLVPLLRTANTYEGVAVNLRNYHSATVVFTLGAVATGGTATFKIQESSNGSSGWGDIAAARLNGTIAVMDTADTVQVIGLTDVGGITKKYIRVYATVATNSVTCAALVIRGNAQHAPASDSNVGAILIS
jgi:6,7-dimethyl-8-ribityllumazine synthase